MGVTLHLRVALLSQSMSKVQLHALHPHVGTPSLLATRRVGSLRRGGPEKCERDDAKEDVEDEYVTVQQVALHSDRQQSVIDRLKDLCAANGIDGAMVQSAIDGNTHE